MPPRTWKSPSLLPSKVSGSVKTLPSLSFGVIFSLLIGPMAMPQAIASESMAPESSLNDQVKAYGSLQGKVSLLEQTDGSGVEIVLRSRQAEGLSAQSKRNGQFQFGRVPCGTYTVTYSKPPYTSQTVRNIPVTEDSETLLDPVLLSWDRTLALGVNSGRHIYASPTMPWAATMGTEGLRLLAMDNGLAPLYRAPKVNPAGVAWSPDGQKLAFVDLNKEGTVTLLDVSHPQAPDWRRGGIALADEERPAWSPASDQVAYRTSDSDFEILTTAGASRSLSLPASVKFRTSSPMLFSPDSQALAFIGNDGRSNGLYRFQLTTQSVVKLCVFGPNPGNIIAFSADATQIYCTLPVDDAGSQYAFFAVPNDSRRGAPSKLLEGVSFQVALSRDQTYLAYYAREALTQVPCVGIANLATKQSLNVGLGGDGEIYLSDQAWLSDLSALLYWTDFDTRMIDLKPGVNLP